MVIVAFEADSASQRMQPLVTKMMKDLGVKLKHGKYIQHILNQRGRIYRCALDSDGEAELLDDDVFIIKPTVLEDQGANTLIEAFLKHCPLELESAPAMRDLASLHDAVLITFCLDRASTNFCMVRYLM